MAKASDKDIIEHDPLAWLDGDNNKQEPTPAVDAEVAERSADTGEVACESGADTNCALVELAVSPNLAGVSELHGQLKEALDGHQTIEIDASNVESIDTSTLQLLLIFRKEVVNLHKTMVFKAPSESLVRSAKLLGLDGVMEL